MFDELVKRLRKKAEAFDYDGWVETASDYEEAADAIEELSRENKEIVFRANQLEAVNDALIVKCEAPRWIPVTDRLPEDLTRVIVFCEDGVSYGLCEHLIADDEEVVEWHDFLYYPITPTHWMPLPEPPKEE